MSRTVSPCLRGGRERGLSIRQRPTPGRLRGLLDRSGAAPEKGRYKALLRDLQFHLSPRFYTNYERREQREFWLRKRVLLKEERWSLLFHRPLTLS